MIWNDVTGLGRRIVLPHYNQPESTWGSHDQIITIHAPTFSDENIYFENISRGYKSWIISRFQRPLMCRQCLTRLYLQRNGNKSREPSKLTLWSFQYKQPRSSSLALLLRLEDFDIKRWQNDIFTSTFSRDEILCIFCLVLVPSDNANIFLISFGEWWWM